MSNTPIVLHIVDDPIFLDIGTTLCGIPNNTMRNKYIPASEAQYYEEQYLCKNCVETEQFPLLVLLYLDRRAPLKLRTLAEMNRVLENGIVHLECLSDQTISLLSDSIMDGYLDREGTYWDWDNHKRLRSLQRINGEWVHWSDLQEYANTNPSLSKQKFPSKPSNKR